MDLEVKKAAGVDAGQVADEAELVLINRFSRKRLTADEVYLFTVRLCDNEVDRDGERFAPETLEALAQAFVGKSGIFDHQWSARGQTARIYRAEVVAEPGRLTKAGDPYRYLKGWAYMLRTQANADLIAEIEGGIKKEVSVGCAVERTVCSICGGNMAAGDCGHIKGHEYDGKLCWGELTGLTDVYEWSFVAVPAQPEAGVLQKRPHLADIQGAVIKRLPEHLAMDFSPGLAMGKEQPAPRLQPCGQARVQRALLRVRHMPEGIKGNDGVTGALRRKLQNVRHNKARARQAQRTRLFNHAGRAVDARHL